MTAFLPSGISWNNQEEMETTRTSLTRHSSGINQLAMSIHIQWDQANYVLIYLYVPFFIRIVGLTIYLYSSDFLKYPRYEGLLKINSIYLKIELFLVSTSIPLIISPIIVIPSSLDNSLLYLKIYFNSK